MVAIRCCYGVCKNDSKKKMEGVYFIPFPIPITHSEKCKRWVQLCGRPHKDFNVEKVGKYTISAQSILSVVLDLQPCIQIQYQQFK